MIGRALVPDDDEQGLGARDGRVEHAAREQHGAGLADAEHDRAVLAALRLVHRHDPCVFKLVEHLEAVGRGLAVVAHCERLRLRVDGRDLTDVAVIDARSSGRTVRVFEHDVIVIADLHDAVALAKDGLAEAPLLLLGRRRVERRLQAHVQCGHAGVILACRREHLNV